MELVQIDRDELAEMLFKARVAGKSERSLAQTYGMSIREVQSLIDVHCPKVDMGKRRRARGVIEEQLASLVEYYLPLGLKGDIQAAAFSLKVLQQQCIVNALEHAPAREVLMPHQVEEHPRPGTVERARAILEQLVAEGLSPPPVEVQATAPDPLPSESSMH